MAVAISSTNSQLRLYLAGPEVFLSNARQIGAAKKALCAKYGFEGLFPYDNELNLPALGSEAAGVIFNANIQMMNRAHCCVANLSPFRGPSGDPGTAFELGYMFAQNKPVFAYTSSEETLKDRLLSTNSAKFDDHFGDFRDSNGRAIEDFGLTDNLMLVCAVQSSGAGVIQKASRMLEPIEDLQAFEECLRVVRHIISKNSHRLSGQLAGKIIHS